MRQRGRCWVATHARGGVTPRPRTALATGSSSETSRFRGCPLAARIAFRATGRDSAPACQAPSTVVIVVWKSRSFRLRKDATALLAVEPLVQPSRLWAVNRVAACFLSNPRDQAALTKECCPQRRCYVCATSAEPAASEY